MAVELEWQEIDEIFSAALELPPEARDVWLDAVCSGRDDVRRRVQRLLDLAEEDDARLPLGTARRILDLLHAFSSSPPGTGGEE